MTNTYRKLLSQGIEALKKHDTQKAVLFLEQALKIRDSWQPLHLLGKAHVQLRNWQGALSYYKKALERDPGNLTIRRRIAETHLALTNINAALVEIKDVIQDSPQPRQHDYMMLSSLYYFTGQYKKSTDILIKFSYAWRRHNRKTVKPGFPVLVAALPKSASTSVTHAVATALEYPQIEFPCRHGPGYFNNSLPIGRIFRALEKTGCVIHSHLDPRENYINILKNYPDIRIVVHFRDPRECLLSAIDMINRTRPPQFLLKNPDLPDLVLEKQVDWMIKNYLPYQLLWIKNWIKVIDDGILDIAQVTTFSDILEKGQDNLAFSICQNLDLVPTSHAGSKPRRFRKGKAKSWIEKFTTQQIEQTNKVIPANIRNRFNWDS